MHAKVCKKKNLEKYIERKCLQTFDTCESSFAYVNCGKNCETRIFVFRCGHIIRHVTPVLEEPNIFYLFFNSCTRSSNVSWCTKIFDRYMTQFSFTFIWVLIYLNCVIVAVDDSYDTSSGRFYRIWRHIVCLDNWWFARYCSSCSWFSAPALIARRCIPNSVLFTVTCGL